MGYKPVCSKKNRGRKWKKGQSSNSNPEAKKFREAAKHRFFNQSKGESSLTVEALSKHDEEMEDEKDVQMSDMDGQTDTQTVGAKTFNTWATNWTDCTNVTFNRVHRYWSSNSAMHKEVLAVLAAVTEVIKQQGGTENETEYFAALMTALETTEAEQSLAAIGYLLSLVLKRVPVAVLRSRFSQIAKQILDMLAKYSDAQSTSLLKSLLLSLAAVLRVQEVAIWSNSSTQQIYTGLLTFITHKKPKVRKSAHQAVKIILKASLCMTQGEPPLHHPAASLTAKYCIQQIEESGGMSDAVDSLHVLSLLKDVMGEFPQSSVKSVCETILKIMTFSNVLVRSCGLQALHGLFASQPKSTCLSAELNAQIITALYDYQPSENDSQPMRAWLAVMQKAHICLQSLDMNLCVSHLPRLVSACMSSLLSDRQDVIKCSSSTLKLLLQECVAPAGKILTKLVKTGSSSSPVHKIVKSLETGLSYQYHSTWGHVLQVWGVAFQVLGKQCYPLLSKCLLSMADLRETPHFAFKSDLDQALGSAVKAIGPHLFLEAVPLQISGDGDDPDFPRSWLIPVFRDNVCDTELGFFTSYFLPLAARFRQKAQQCTERQNVVTAKSYEALQLQIWSLLPGFCKNPTDIAQSFKGIAKVLGSAITERADLRMKVLASLRSLIAQNLGNETNKAELARFGKNFLPILFNLYTADPEMGEKPQRLAVLSTVKSYLQICDKQGEDNIGNESVMDLFPRELCPTSNLVTSFFDRCLAKMTEEDITVARSLSLVDLMMSLLMYIEERQLKKAFDLAVPNLTSTNKTLQKKAYRVLQEICSGKSEESQAFTTNNLKMIQKLLLSSLSKSGPSSKAPRLRCLISILKQLEKPQMEFFLAIVPEAMLCTKEVAERARVAAYDLLMVMAETVIRWNVDRSEADSVGDFIKMLLAGLAGSPQMISGTLLALTRLLYGYKDKISSDLLDTLVENVCLLLTSKTREIVKSGLGFIKVMLSAYTETRLAGQLKTLVSSLVGMKEDCRHHCHAKVKQIYSKLIKKFGYDTIHGMTPVSVHKLLNNIRKTQERAKKKKVAGEASDSEEDLDVPKNKPESVDDLLRDTDSEMEEDQEQKKKPTERKKGQQGKGAWLKEGGADQIMDFLDPSAAKKVMATKPQMASKTKKDSDFKMSADGRLVFTETVDDEGEKMDSADEDDLDDLFKAFEAGTTKRRRAPKRKLEEDSDDDTAKPKYKAGGKGIHRPVGQGAQDVRTKTVGHEYKSRKAGGDVKKQGKHDPYAYVPLNRQMLNKRKQARLQGQFKGLVKGAKKGAAQGARNKKRKK